MENTSDTNLDRFPDSEGYGFGEYEPTPDAQTVAAYFSYLDHGSVPGHDVRDWLESEAWLVNDNHLARRA